MDFKSSHIIFLKKLQSTARAIITNQVAMPLGAMKITRLIFQAEKSGALKGFDLRIFSEYVNQFNGCPVGTERLLWDKSALKEQDRYLDELTGKYRDQIMEKCFEIVSIGWIDKR